MLHVSWTIIKFFYKTHHHCFTFLVISSIRLTHLIPSAWMISTAGFKICDISVLQKPLTHRREWGKVQLKQAVPWLALPERMSPACSQAEKHTQIPSDVNQSWHSNGCFHSLLGSFMFVNILQSACRRMGNTCVLLLTGTEKGQTRLCIKIDVDGPNLYNTNQTSVHLQAI